MISFSTISAQLVINIWFKHTIFDKRDKNELSFAFFQSFQGLIKKFSSFIRFRSSDFGNGITI